MEARLILIERFGHGQGAVGYHPSGTIWAVDDHPFGTFPVTQAINGIQDPTAVAAAFAAALAGRLAVPFKAASEVCDLTVGSDGIFVALDLPEDSYEQRLSLQDFAPVLGAWQQAWAAMQAYQAVR